MSWSRPDTTGDREIDLYEVVQGLQQRDLTAPVVIRFSDILAHRLRHLHDAFARAIAENDYRNRYAAVYPIKVNQQRLVVEEVFRYGKEFGFGLEAGSKPELLAVMAMSEASPDRLIVCNGFKDSSYIEAVILATKLGRCIVPVVENFAELDLILKHADHYGVRPKIGVRVKLSSEGSGRWSGSAGEKSKFGLFVTEILELMAVLKARGMEDCLKLVHCHPGSQLQDIRRIKDAIDELAHVYAELKLLGAGLEYIDVGGGLGVDYDGSGTNYASSMNYTLAEYASDVVYRIASVCNARGIEHPMIVSESGRAMAAHHSVLIFNTLGASALDRFQIDAEEVERAPARQVAAAAVARPDRRLAHRRRAPPGRVLPRRADRPRRRAAAVQAGPAVAADARTGRAAVLVRLRAHPRLLPQARADARGARGPRDRAVGHLLLQFLGVPVAAGQLGHRPAVPDHAHPPARRMPRRASACWPTSPATPTARSTTSSASARSSARWNCTRCATARSTTSPPSWSAPTRKRWATCTTCSATRTWCTSSCTTRAAGGSRRSSRATPPTRCWSTWSTTSPNSTPALSRDCERAVREGRMTVAESQALKRFYEQELDGYAYLEA